MILFLFSFRDSRARYYYHLQLRDNFITYPILYPDDRSFLLAIYAILADQSLYSLQYLDPRLYFPAWVSCCQILYKVQPINPALSDNLVRVWSNASADSVMNLLFVNVYHGQGRSSWTDNTNAL